MKYEKSNGAGTDLVIDSFGGLDRSRALCGGKGSFELRNLRLMADGTLSRRPGLCPVATFPSKVRGAMAITRGGQEEWYAVAGDTVYYLAPDGEGHRPLAVGTLTTQTGEVDFLCYDGTLLMLDGEELYTLTPTEAKETEAYVPLYGREWQTGDITTHVAYEQPNLLTRRLRLQYRMSAKGKTMPLYALVPERVDAILVNGEPYKGNFSYGQLSRLISTGDEQEEGSLIEVYLTMPDSQDRPRVTRAGRMAAIDRAEEARVLFYDLPGEGEAWISRSPADISAASVRAVLPNVCKLYVTEQDKVIVGDGVHRVTGAARHYDRSLLFTAHGAWMSEGEVNEDGTLKLIPINTTLGCSHPGALALIGNHPMTVHERRVLSWNSDTDERNECNATSVSTPVEAFIANGKGKMRAFADTPRGDVWFYCSGGDGRVLIYQSEQGSWTSYDGFKPQCLALMAGDVCLGMGQTLYRMDEKATADTLVDDDHPDGVRVGIEAEYQSAFWDFGAPDRVKRLCRTAVIASCSRGRATLTLQSVSGRRVYLPMEGDGCEVSVMQERAPMGRFRFLRVGLVSDDDAPLRLHSIRLSARHS